jgi:hypothetical protein
MCYEEDRPVRGFMWTLIVVIVSISVFIAASQSCGAQQPNSDRASLRLDFYGSYGPTPIWGAGYYSTPGPYVFNPSTTTTPLYVTLWVHGGAGCQFELWGNAYGPAATGASVAGGLCDLDLTQTIGLLWGSNLPGADGGDYQAFAGTIATIAPSPSEYTVQGWVEDPTRPDGVRLTGAIYAYH